MTKTQPRIKEAEQKAQSFVIDFLEPYFSGSLDFKGEYSPGGKVVYDVRQGELALAAQTLLIWGSSRRLERLTLLLVILTGVLLALTIILAYLTARLV